MRTELIHRDGCKRAPSLVVEFVGNLGHIVRRCKGCGAFLDLDDRTPIAVRATLARARGYACRPHNEPVTWQGKGCKRCTAELTLTKAERTARRRREQQAGDDKPLMLDQRVGGSASPRHDPRMSSPVAVPLPPRGYPRSRARAILPQGGIR